MIAVMLVKYPTPPAPSTCPGTAVLFVPPLPNCPWLFNPHVQTVPSDFRTICSDPPPPHIETTRGEELVAFRNTTREPDAVATPTAFFASVKITRATPSRKV